MPKGESTAAFYRDWQGERIASVRELLRAAATGWSAWLPTLRCWNVFVTLTYDQRRLEAMPSIWKFERDVRAWLRDCEKALGRQIAAAVFMERQLNGWPHGHGLLDVGGLGERDIELMGRLWWRRAGLNRIEVPWSTGDAAGYCAKYVSKDRLDGLVLSDGLLQQVMQLMTSSRSSRFGVRPRRTGKSALAGRSRAAGPSRCDRDP